MSTSALDSNHIEEKKSASEEDLAPKVKKNVDPRNEGDPIPVTILSGFLGSGKTTLLNYILESSDHGMKVAVIVNDMAELNIDAALVQQKSSLVAQTERELISLANGCICCTLRGDLIREISRIRAANEFDYVLIESTGIAEPQQVAQAFVFDPATAELAESEEQMLWTQARLDTTVTVIDSHTFHQHMDTLLQFSDAFEDGLDKSTPEGLQEGEKSISNLLVEQVEFANVILLNKTDLVTQEEQDKLANVIKTLNPKAKLLKTQYSKVDLKEIINTGKFDMRVARESPGWMLSIREIQENGNHVVSSEADEYGVSSFVYRARVPFHPKKLASWMGHIFYSEDIWRQFPEDVRKLDTDRKIKYMKDNYGTILRAKGFCWLAGHDSLMFGLSQSGRIGEITAMMHWFTIIPKEQWGTTDTKDLAVIESKFQAPHGDRRQEFVFIGTDLKVDAIRKSLDACLLSKKELKHYEFYNNKGGYA